MDSVNHRLMETYSQEIQALAKVSHHPNIVTLYRPTTTPDGRPVLVLELCRGSLAAQVRREGPMDAGEVTRVGIKIAGALETAHRNGFLHRDMKPQNILVTQFGEPALGDFGVAALQTSAQSTAGVFGFTTLHAAPEILEGNHLSPATDVYGLASTMYQLLSGLAPFAAFDNEAPASVILRIIRDPVRPLRSDTIPLGLSDLLEAALSKDPALRPQRAIDFADALVGIERANGWPATAYVAWDQTPGSGLPLLPLRPPSPAPPAPVDTPERSVPDTSPSEHLYPTAPSVRVAEAGERRPLAAEPVPPPVPVHPAPEVPTPVSPVARPVTPPGFRPETGELPAQPPRLAPLPPLRANDLSASVPEHPEPPPAPSYRSGPAVATPGSAERYVVRPDQVGRGHDGPARPPDSNPPLAPLTPSHGRIPAPQRPTDLPARPVFLDPEDRSVREPDSALQQTILPSSLRRSSQQRDTPAPLPASDRSLPLLVVAGIGVAALVVVAAILLIVGVF